MKKLIAVVGIILIGYVIFSATAGGMRGAAADAGPRGEESDTVYVMREENGRVVVYRNDTIYLSTDTQVSSLPKNDRVKLEKGITVFSEEELKRLVEDYCS